MQDFRFGSSKYNNRSSTSYDEGLRKYFLKIYSLMSGALVLTAIWPKWWERVIPAMWAYTLYVF